MRRAGIAVLTLLSLALASVIALELRPDRPQAELAPVSPSRAAPPLQSRAPVASADQRQAWLDTILARPLFSPNRRPPAAATAAPGAPPTLPRVAGILMDGGRRSVIFAPAGERRPVVVNEGAGLDGFRVELIEAGRVTVVGPSGRQVLRPSFDPNPPPAAAVAAQAPPGLLGLPGLQGLPGLTGIPGLPTPNAPVAR